MSLAVGTAWVACFVEASLDDTCTIKQRTSTNAGSGPTVVESDRATGVKCRRAPISNRAARELAIDGQPRDQLEQIVTLLVDQACAVTDRLVFSNGDSVEVVGELVRSRNRFCRRWVVRKV